MECSFVCLFSDFPLTVRSCAAFCSPRSPLRRVARAMCLRRSSLSNRNVICAWRACEHLLHRKAKRHYRTRIQKSLLMGRSANPKARSEAERRVGPARRSGTCCSPFMPGFSSPLSPRSFLHICFVRLGKRVCAPSMGDGECLRDAPTEGPLR